jgi:dihydroflavonol-4-reductase
MIADFASRFSGREPAVTPEVAALMGRVSIVSSAKAQHDLGYRIVSLHTMVKDCYDWMVAEGRI